MKKLVLIALSAFTLTTTSIFATPGGKDGPCRKIKEACESAGFVKGGHKEGKGLFVDCMRKVIDGESVAGVTVAAEDVAACQARKAERAEHREARQAKRAERREAREARKAKRAERREARQAKRSARSQAEKPAEPSTPNAASSAPAATPEGH